MSTKAISNEKIKAYVRLLGNPYASLSFYDDPSDSLEQRQAEFRKLENPHAHSYFFGEPDDESGNAGSRQTLIEFGDATHSRKKVRESKSLHTTNLEKQLDGVLQLYRPYVSRNDWVRVNAYRGSFLERASRTPQVADKVIAGLGKLKFSLMPDEKVEFNRAPVDKIISELEKLLS
jgi:hypothetical protein